jgi:hypothetical protein
MSNDILKMRSALALRVNDAIRVRPHDFGLHAQEDFALAAGSQTSALGRDTQAKFYNAKNCNA